MHFLSCYVASVVPLVHTVPQTMLSYLVLCVFELWLSYHNRLNCLLYFLSDLLTSINISMSWLIHGGTFLLPAKHIISGVQDDIFHGHPKFI